MSQNAMLTVWGPSLAGGLIGWFVGDLVSDMRPNSKYWGLVSKVSGLIAGVTVGSLLTPNPQAQAYAGAISTF